MEKVTNLRKHRQHYRGDNSYQGGVAVQPGLLIDTELHQPIRPDPDITSDTTLGSANIGSG